MTDHIHTEFHRFLSQREKESQLAQRGVVVWMTGLSGSGKSTIANTTERQLHLAGRMTVILDGDNLRTGLNSDLGFSDSDRKENIRRTAEVAKLFASQGVITFVSLITPKNAFRHIARNIIGAGYHEVYIRASFEQCAARDPKGLYKKAAAGQVSNFTGKDSGFEEPDSAELVLDTGSQSVDQCTTHLIAYLNPQIDHGSPNPIAETK